MTVSARIFGDAVAPDLLVQTAGAYGWEAASLERAPVDHAAKNILLIGKVDSGALTERLAQPYDAFIEMIGDKPDLGEDVVDALEQNKVIFSFATDTAYQMDSAALICEMLAQRGVLSMMRRSDVELSLHESISNAVVHGNLALKSNMKGDFSNFAAFGLELQQRMLSPDAKKRVNIIASWDSEFLDLSVCDKGDGYDESKLPVNVDPFAPAGRGLAIIRSLTLAMNVTHGGRVTTLRFLI